MSRRSEGDGDANAAIRALVESNPGQASFEEYQLVHDLIVAKAPCNVLVFGVGRDTTSVIGHCEPSGPCIAEPVDSSTCVTCRATSRIPGGISSSSTLRKETTGIDPDA